MATKRIEKVDISKPDDSSDLFETEEANAVYDAIEDISPLMVTSPHSSVVRDPHQSSAGESMTGGVGTTFYRAPEQEGRQFLNKKGGSDGSYNVRADIFSLGVILFEMFFPPFDTVRGEKARALHLLFLCHGYFFAHPFDLIQNQR